MRTLAECGKTLMYVVTLNRVSNAKEWMKRVLKTSEPSDYRREAKLLFWSNGKAQRSLKVWTSEVARAVKSY